MKKILLFLLLGLALAPAAFSQARAGGNLSSTDYTPGGTDSRNTGFGVKGGYSLSNFFGAGNSIFPNRDNLNTYQAGLYGQFGLNDFSSVQVELLYSRKGIRYTYPGAGLNDLRLDYLSLPILYVGNITNNFSFHVGPELSLLTKVNANGQSLDIKTYGFNSFDVSGLLGLEYRIGPARIGARYDLGLAPIFSNSAYRNSSYLASAGTTMDRVTNQTFQIYLGVGFTQ